jgi:hypothetical protein
MTADHSALEERMKSFYSRPIAWLLVLLIAFPLPVPVAAQSDAPPLKPEEIEQLVAPIALYPDSLVSQILMASTYPLEIVEADRWAKQNANLKGDALSSALDKQNWDPSVKSLVQFPKVLAGMSEKLDLTQKMGDAMLAQQKDVMDAVQRLRAKAQKEGNLKTTKEQNVIVEQPTATQQTTVIKIEPADPQVVYVPQYNPTVVYGAWPYPAYPPYSYYPFAGAALGFATGVAMGAAWGWAFGGCNWGGGHVDVDVNRNVNYNKNINRNNYRGSQGGQGGTGQWQHDASHRKGVGYKDNATAQKFNKGTNSQAAKSREQFRGRAESGRQELAREGGAGVADRKGGAGDRGGIGDKGGPGDRGGIGDKGGAGDRGGGLGDKGGVGDRGGPGDRGGAGGREGGPGDRGGGAGAGDRASAGNRAGGGGGGLGSSSRGGGGGEAFQGVGKGSETRSASARGASSRGGGGGGGGARGGGGGGGGGARGGGGGGGGGRRR